MKLLKFLIKYFMFRSTQKVENIKKVIEKHGFHICPYCVDDMDDPVTDFLIDVDAYEYASRQKSFVAPNDIANTVFIRDGLSEADQVILLFHEEAHIWYDHPFIKSFTDNTETQQDNTANLFLFKLRALKRITYLTLLVLVFAGAGLFLPKKASEPLEVAIVSAAAIDADEPPAQLMAYTEPEEPAQGKTVYITPSGYAYHRSDCYHIAYRTNVTSISAEQAVGLGRSPCKTCRP